MTETERRLQAQMDQNTAMLRSLQMQQQYRQRQQQAYQPPQEDDYEPADDPGTPPQYAGQPDPYQGVDPNALMMQAITNEAARRAATAVQHTSAMTNAQAANTKKRMERIVQQFPAMAEEGSPLVIQARKEFARINQENPGLDVATKTELAVHAAANLLGARPANLAIEDDTAWVMGSGQNPALPSKPTRSRLTNKILMNAQLMGINIDAKTKQGQANLKELSEYSARFNADQDESQYRYR